MDWSNEIFVKLYVRETDDDLVLSWEARALWHEMLKRFDRSGFIPMRRACRGLAAVVRMPVDVVEAAMVELLADGRVRENADGYFAPNFLAAQEATKSDKLRQRESRDRKRAQHLADSLPVTNRDAEVTERNGTSVLGVTIRDRKSLSADPLHCSADSPARTNQPAPSRASDPEETDRTARRVLGDEVWRELAAARARVAAALGVELRPLHPQDQGRTALALRIREAASLEAARADCAHVLAVREAEALFKAETKWLSGSMFEERGWRTALAASLAEAKRRPPTRAPFAASPGLRIVSPASVDDMPPIPSSGRKA